MISRLVHLSRYVSFAHYTIRRHVSRFAAHVGPRRRILDLGSGKPEPYKGLFDLPGEGSIYVSVDRFERADIQGDAQTLPLPTGWADLILCTEVLEHLPAPREALVEMNRVLAPDGFLVLTVPLVWGEHHHVDYQRWTEAGLHRILQTTDFAVHTIHRRGGIFSTVGCLITRIPHQVFGQLREQRCWLIKVLYLLCWLLTIPIPWLLALLDPLDRERCFILGYSLLCRKAAP